MMKNVFVNDYALVTPLGFTLAENYAALLVNRSGIQQHQNDKMPSEYWSSIIDEEKLNSALAQISDDSSFSKIQKMSILALSQILSKSSQTNQKTGFILSTTKGDIEALAKNDLKKAELSSLAQSICDYFAIKTKPIVLSNACVSGVMAISVGKRLIQSGLYDEVYIVAADLASEFVLSGFNSFQAMSNAPCKPYSANRTGVTLGEAAAAMRISSDKNQSKAQILGDGSRNDANHISGPSRTGEGLFLSIESALKEAGISKNEIGFISAHGTATPFNDEMEAIAFNRLELEKTPVHSLKGYYGHTLGTSGLLESIIGIEALNNNQLIASIGFDEMGVSQPIAVIEKHQNREMTHFLKTASGFGGCNTAVIFKKI